MKLRLFEFYFIKDYLRPWFGLIYSLFFLFFLGAIGYRITEGWEWSDCLWMVLITITTVSYTHLRAHETVGNRVCRPVRSPSRSRTFRRSRPFVLRASQPSYRQVFVGACSAVWSNPTHDPDSAMLRRVWVARRGRCRSW